MGVGLPRKSKAPLRVLPKQKAGNTKISLYYKKSPVTMNGDLIVSAYLLSF